MPVNVTPRHVPGIIDSVKCDRVVRPDPGLSLQVYSARLEPTSSWNHYTQNFRCAESHDLPFDHLPECQGRALLCNSARTCTGKSLILGDLAREKKILLHRKNQLSYNSSSFVTPSHAKGIDPMKGDDAERWVVLCEQAVKEQDHEKLMLLVEEINRLLEKKSQRLHCEEQESRHSA